MTIGGETTTARPDPSRPGEPPAWGPPDGAHDDGESTLDLQDLLNPDEQRRFRRLCFVTSANELSLMSDVVDLHLDHVRTNATAITDVETAEVVADRLQAVLALTAELDSGQRSLVRGAVEYFVLNDDSADDLNDALGFDDDARVLNSVLDRIGRPDLHVDLTR